MLLVLLWLVWLASRAQASDLTDRVLSLESRVSYLELELRLFSGGTMIPPAPASRVLSKAELEEVLQIDETGEATRKDKLSTFPEICTFVAMSSGRRDLITGLGVELFHQRNLPRRHKLTFKLLLGNEWVGFSAGYILVPVINFNVGPFIGKDLEAHPTTGKKETVWGLQASVFSF